MGKKKQTTLDRTFLHLDGSGSLFEQLARAMKRAILEGRYGAGAPLPASRTLARVLRMSRTTVVAAYELLAVEELVVARTGSGTRVAYAITSGGSPTRRADLRAPSRYAARARRLGPSTIALHRPPRHYELHYGTPLVNPALYRSWRRKLSAAAFRAGPGYPAPEGYLPLREALCEYLARRRGVTCTPDRVLVVGGTQQAFTIIARVLLDEGGRAVLEEPSYELARHVLAAHGARIAHVRTDEEGLVVSDLPQRRGQVIFVTPSHQFPSGALMSLARRLELLQFASRHSAWIVEDDYDSEFRYEGPLPPALQSLDMSDRVIYVGTFSKSLFPSVRLGYIVCPNCLRDDFSIAKKLDDLGCASIDQAALAAFLRSRQFDRHLRWALIELKARREALAGALRSVLGDEVDFADTKAGVHLVVYFKRLDYRKFERLLSMAGSAGLGLYSIHHAYRTRPPRPGVLMGFAGLTTASLIEAVGVLAQCLARLHAQTSPGANQGSRDGPIKASP